MIENHEMTQVMVYESGAEEWTCKVCGRHMVIQSSPFKRIVLTKGNDDVQHTGGSFACSPEVSVKSDSNFDDALINTIEKKQLH